MRAPDLLALAAGNLRRNRQRSVLTLVGVAVGVAALYALLAYGAGLQKLAADEFAALDLYNTLRVTSAPDPVDSFADLRARDRSDPRLDRPPVPITDSLLAALAARPDVLAAFPEVAFPVRLRTAAREVFAGAEAVPMAFRDLPAYRPSAGTFFASAEEPAVLLPPTMAERLGFAPAETAVGDSLELVTATLDVAQLQRALFGFAFGQRALPLREHTTRVRVAGLLPAEGQALSGFVRVVVPLAFADSLPKVTFFSTLDLLARGPETGGYPAARVQLRDEAAFEPVRAAIEAEGLFATGFRERFAQLQRLFAVLDGSLLVIGLIALLVATLGIANTMAMNVMERRREIGVMKAVGGEDATVLRLFLVESLLLGALGAALGLAVGWAVTRLLNAGVNAYLARLGVAPLEVFHAPPGVVLGIAALALGVAALAGLAPARRAARVEPVEALRS